MRRTYRAAAAAALLSASAAWAVAKGGSLYIKSVDVQLLKEPKATAAKLMKLEVGSEVKWLGASDKDKQFHEIEVKGKKGFVMMANLSPAKPQMEVVGTKGEPVSPQAFASSGAATKALTPAGINYAKGEGASAQEAAAEIIHVEEYNKAKATAPALAAKAKELGGAK